jgi:hypothetical protein
MSELHGRKQQLVKPKYPVLVSWGVTFVSVPLAGPQSSMQGFNIWQVKGQSGKHRMCLDKFSTKIWSDLYAQGTNNRPKSMNTTKIHYRTYLLPCRFKLCYVLHHTGPLWIFLGLWCLIFTLCWVEEDQFQCFL